VNSMQNADTCNHPEDLEFEKEFVEFYQAMEDSIASGAEEVRAQFGSFGLVLGLPPLGEGDMSLVFPLKRAYPEMPADPLKLCVKVAKQYTLCRDCLIEEEATTKSFLDERICVPRIHYMDPSGRFAIKDFIEGESVTSIYMRFDTFPVWTQSLILEGLEKFLSGLLQLFERKPECKVSISPNNIYLLTEGERFRSPMEFVLIDPGPSRVKNYEGLSFDKYWNDLLPNRIDKYKRTGYLQWILPREVSEAEREEAKEFDIFRDLNDDEILAIMDIADSVEFDTGQVILREGTVGESFYLVMDGEVMLRKGLYSKSKWQTKLRSGSVLGEMGFLLKVPRSMSAVATTHCRLIEISHEKYEDLLVKNLPASYKLLRNISAILAERLYKLDLAHQKLLEAQERAAC